MSGRRDWGISKLVIEAASFLLTHLKGMRIRTTFEDRLRKLRGPVADSVRAAAHLGDVGQTVVGELQRRIISQQRQLPRAVPHLLLLLLLLYLDYWRRSPPIVILIVTVCAAAVVVVIVVITDDGRHRLNGIVVEDVVQVIVVPNIMNMLRIVVGRSAVDTHSTTGNTGNDKGRVVVQVVVLATSLLVDIFGPWRQLAR